MHCGGTQRGSKSFISAVRMRDFRPGFEVASVLLIKSDVYKSGPGIVAPG